MEKRKTELSDEGRRILNQVWGGFSANKVTRLEADIYDILKRENGDTSPQNVMRLFLMIGTFLAHSGYVRFMSMFFIATEKGAEVKKYGTLEAYEAHLNSQ